MPVDPKGGLWKGLLAARRKRIDAQGAQVQQGKAALDHLAAREGLRIDTYQRGPAVEPRQVFDAPLVSIETLGYNAVEQIQALALMLKWSAIGKGSCP